MALREIVQYPHRSLRRVAEEVTQIDGSILTLVDDMIETMYDAQGVGLAAPQINCNYRIVVMDCSERANQPMVVINPQILAVGEQMQSREEGCLSIGDYREMVTRPATVTFRAMDRHGEWYEREATDLMAACIQHEIDHLNGKLFIDYLSPLKQQRIKKRQEKMLKAERR